MDAQVEQELKRISGAFIAVEFAVMKLGTMRPLPQQTLELMRRLKEDLPWYMRWLDQARKEK